MKKNIMFLLVLPLISYAMEPQQPITQHKIQCTLKKVSKKHAREISHDSFIHGHENKHQYNGTDRLQKLFKFRCFASFLEMSKSHQYGE